MASPSGRRGSGNAFVRVVGTDDVQAAAVARSAFTGLGLRRVAVIDDTDTFGVGVADRFSAAWTALGGTIVGRQGAPAGTTDYLPILTALAAQGPDALLFGGMTATGAATVRRQMAQAGLGELPFLAGEGLVDGTGEDAGSFVAVAGAAAAGSWSTSASVADYPGRAAFEEAFRARYGGSPPAYGNDAYACGQVITAAIARVAADGPVTREAVRRAVTDPGATFDTVLGPIAFDANGDPTVAVSTLYRVDLGIDPDPAVPGAGAWVPVARIDVPGASPTP
ncbi:MAG: branched-chain amino acid ABC transporter substrate-binding protein [Chloroflexota bacterium]